MRKNSSQSVILSEGSKVAAKVLEEHQKFSYLALVAALLRQRHIKKESWGADGWSAAFMQSLVDALDLPKKRGEGSLAQTLQAMAEHDQGDGYKEHLKADGEQVCNMIAEHLLVHSLVYSPKAGYDARARQLVKDLCLALSVSWESMVARETMIAHELVAKRDGEVERKKKPFWKSPGRMGMVGGAAVLGGVLLTVTGGLAAPLVVAGASGLTTTILGGGTILSTTLAMLGTTGGLALVSGLFGATGAGLAGYRMARVTAEVSEFEFVRVGESNEMNVCIEVSGWLKNREDFTRSWEKMPSYFKGEIYSLVWESKELMELGNAISRLMGREAAYFVGGQVLRQTILAPIMAAMVWPGMLLKASSLIDNPWHVVMSRSERCGRALAEVLSDRVQGNRPVTLIGYSMGARALYFCLEELFRRREFGIVENCFLIGAPLQARAGDWDRVSQVVAGRLVNVYNKSDMVLGFLMRSTTLPLPIAGLRPASSSLVENVNITDIGHGHSSYRKSEVLEKVLQRVNVDGERREETLQDDVDDDEGSTTIEIVDEAVLSAEGGSPPDAPVPSSTAQAVIAKPEKSASGPDAADGGGGASSSNPPS